MSKEKLTLYMDHRTSRLAHEVARSVGKSISELVREYTVRMHHEIQSDEISPAITKWIGALKTRKSYKALRDQIMGDRLKQYENPG
jgi:Family of unknown function (DUF6364)